MLAFTRPGDEAAQALAREVGAEWAGAVGERPEELDAAIIFAPAGELVPEALAAIGKGGTVVCAGIHIEPDPVLPVRAPLGRSRAAVGREPDPRRRPAALPRRRRPSRSDGSRGVPTRCGERGARPPPQRCRPGCRRPDDLAERRTATSYLSSRGWERQRGRGLPPIAIASPRRPSGRATNTRECELALDIGHSCLLLVIQTGSVRLRERRAAAVARRSSRRRHGATCGRLRSGVDEPVRLVLCRAGVQVKPDEHRDQHHGHHQPMLQ